MRRHDGEDQPGREAALGRLGAPRQHEPGGQDRDAEERCIDERVRCPAFQAQDERRKRDADGYEDEQAEVAERVLHA